MLWLNDSKATNLHALEAALKSQNSPVVLIAGGKDKGLDYLGKFSVLAAGAGFSSGDFENLARR